MNTRKRDNSKRRLAREKQHNDSSFDDELPGNGFESLMHAVETIKTSQQTTESHVTDVHQAIYDPDDGLFARIRTAEQAVLNKTGEVEKEVVELATWKDHVDKDINDKQDELAQLTGRLDAVELELRELVGWRDRVVGIYRWVFIAFGGAIVTLLFKFVYDMLKNHVQFRF